MGNSPLASQLPRLFACARDGLAKACDCMVLHGDCINCGLIFRRYLTVIEEAEFFLLLEVLAQFSYLGGGSDSRVWIPSKDGALSVALLF